MRQMCDKNKDEMSENNEDVLHVRGTYRILIVRGIVPKYLS